MQTNKLFPETELIEKAIRICVKNHFCQRRKGDGKPYYIHPISVALKIAKHGFPEVAIAAALTHDILEDTFYNEKKFKEKLGDEVFDIVKTVTQDEHRDIKDKGERWKTKKREYIEKVKYGSVNAKAICAADKIHNLESFLMAYQKQGEKLWGKFNATRENKQWFEREVLKMLKETFDHPLTREYENLIQEEENICK